MQIIAADGPLDKELKNQVAQWGISDLVHFLGFRENVIPYIQAADLLVHLSVSESSNQVIKEVGYCGKTVVVCKGVGDFDDYLNETNAYLIERDFSEEDLIATIELILDNKDMLKIKGENLKKTVLERFSFQDKIVNQYLALFA